MNVMMPDELGEIAIWVAKRAVDHAALEAMLVPAIDALARSGSLVQAVLARWSIAGGSTRAPYEAVVGIGGDTAARAWATRWIRAIGRGQLWLGRALCDRIDVARGTDAVELGPALRIAVDDVAATERQLASLLPARDDYRAFESGRPSED